MKMPSQGLAESDLFARMQAYRAQDLDTHGGRTWAYVYDSGRAEVEEVAKAAYLMFLSENALDPTVFPSLLKFENELVAMSAAHLGGDSEVVGNFTSGGTESCMLAVKTARDYARAHRPHITRPEIILPVTAHAAFHKAAHYLDVTPVLVKVDPLTFKADVDAIRAAITPNTIQIIASAVSYAHGVIDPIPELGALALEHGLLLHVDGCIGGFLLPYFKRLNAPITEFDFSVPGVTSISMDLHKYGYCPKGASIILHKNKDLRRHQLFACAHWTGYTILNTTILSTKSGGPLAAAWAVVNFIGDEGYLELARKTLVATQRIIRGIQEMPDLQVMGTPECSLIAISSETVDVFVIIDEMRSRGWYVQPQLGYMGSKSNIHLSVTAASLDRVDGLLKDLAQSVEAAKVYPVNHELLALLGTLEGLDLTQVPVEAYQQLLALAGVHNGKLPERLAGINALLANLPPAVTESLLKEFVNDLYRQ